MIQTFFILRVTWRISFGASNRYRINARTSRLARQKQSGISYKTDQTLFLFLYRLTRVSNPKTFTYDLIRWRYFSFSHKNAKCVDLTIVPLGFSIIDITYVKACRPARVQICYFRCKCSIYCRYRISVAGSCNFGAKNNNL